MGTALKFSAETPLSFLSSAGIIKLYEENFEYCVRLAYLLTSDVALAEDIAQDSFIKAASRVSSLRRNAAFRPYLRMIVVNEVRMHGRHAKVVTDRNPLELKLPSEVDSASIVAVKMAMMALPIKERAAVVFRFYEDLPDAETAAILKCRQATVRSLVARGLARLRQQLGDVT